MDQMRSEMTVRERNGQPTKEAPTRTRLLIVDDHTAVRAGLRQLLDSERDFEVIADVAGAQSAMKVAAREPVDVAVVDYQLGQDEADAHNGLWVSRKLKRLANPPAVLIYSAYADGVLAAAAVLAAADGIVSKGSLGSELCAAVRSVAHGTPVLPSIPSWLADTIRKRFDDEEQAIFGMLLARIPADEIARLLGLSTAGLESQLWGMLRALETPSVQARYRGTANPGV